MAWVQVAKETECPPGQCIERVVDGRMIALFNVGGVFHALDGVCAHQGGPLGKGQLEGCVVTCPWHGWQFDVRDGQSLLSPSVRQMALLTRHENGIVSVQIQQDLGNSIPDDRTTDRSPARE